MTGPPAGPAAAKEKDRWSSSDSSRSRWAGGGPVVRRDGPGRRRDRLAGGDHRRPRGHDAFGALAGGLVGIGAIVLLPILYGGLGFVVAIIARWLYNLAAGFVGGIEIDVQ